MITFKRKAFIILLCFCAACLPASTVEVVQLDKPDLALLKRFGLEESYEIHYQYYQKYGFTDLEEQLILIVQPESPIVFQFSLPLDSLDLLQFQSLAAHKFQKDKPIDYKLEQRDHADIRIESSEFQLEQPQQLYAVSGSYEIIRNDTLESIFLFDDTTGLLYIESKLLE